MPLPDPDLSEFTSPELIEKLRGREDLEMVLDEMTLMELLKYLVDRIQAEGGEPHR